MTTTIHIDPASLTTILHESEIRTGNARADQIKALAAHVEAVAEEMGEEVEVVCHYSPTVARDGGDDLRSASIVAEVCDAALIRRIDEARAAVLSA